MTDRDSQHAPAFDRDFDLAAFLKTLTQHPGVYRMFDAKGDVIYVGKAKNLKRRVSSYFQKTAKDAKTMALVAAVGKVDVTVTNTETEALILEANLIKQFRPRYNILLRDDKSYPYIHLNDHEYPRISFYRGARKKKGQFFGPYPSAGAVRDTLNILQKLFQIRPCRDSFFANRSRPCLQYQIKRCSAPCVGYVTPEEYQRDIDNAVKFLQGRNEEVIEDFGRRMDAAAEALEYERAAMLRDQIASLRTASERQYVDSDGGDVDVVAAVKKGGLNCVAILFIRGGRSLGSKTWFPQHANDADESEVLTAFLPQYYLEHEPPKRILLNHGIEDAKLLEESLASETGKKVTISHRVRGERQRWLDMAARNAEQAATTRLASDMTLQQRFDSLADALQLDTPPTRIECFDISHTRGEATVASCVVFGREGAIKSDYRRFNIDGIEPGDDYAAMHQALTRRYLRLKKGEGVIPDVLLIDGGKGQLRQAIEVMEELQIDDILLVGVAKGPSRKPGLEQLFLAGSDKPLILAPDSPGLHLIQQVRDEAHRFAIAGHQHRRGKARRESTLESIEGLGPKRRQELLKAFGGLQGVSRAGIEDLSKVKGISGELAKRVYEYFHGSD
ncbi:MAG: excinuclease ABC subunit UvrC [Gammaproteobacteria bacterium]|nr:excinuclease ABC subunit UvrC [Gammaproteobacteria bacterium]